MSTEMAGMQSLVAKSYAEPRQEGPRFLNFGSFTVDLKREELFKEGARVKLPGKVYQTLVTLLHRPGEVVSREDLRQRLWPEGTHVNYDANVNTTVNKLRIALGDSPDRPIYVETIPRQGYSFVGTVSAATHGVSVSSRDGNGSVAVASGTELTAVVAKEVELSQAEGISKWFVAGVIALVLAGMMLGAATVLYLHRSI